MKVLFINETCGTGSHGKICVQQARQLEAEGHQCKVAYGRYFSIPEETRDLAVQIGSKLDRNVHAVESKLFDMHGFGSVSATKKFLDWADEFDPDMIWMHNIHGYFINVEMLFAWIKKRPEMDVNWTLHDCWAFTGHCAHFMSIGCEKWKTKCQRCPLKRAYPESILLERSQENFVRKRVAFTGLLNGKRRVRIITPSNWLANQVRNSFLKEYPVEVVHNQINTVVFRPDPECANEGVMLRENYHLGSKKIVLGISSAWTDKKGLPDYYKLAEHLPEQFQMVLVGLSEKQKKRLPSNIIGIRFTSSQKELAALYREAEVLVNLSYEENYPTVNLEAEACGTRVITYDAGGARETIAREDSTCVPIGNWDRVLELLGKD